MLMKQIHCFRMWNSEIMYIVHAGGVQKLLQPPSLNLVIPVGFRGHSFIMKTLGVLLQFCISWRWETPLLGVMAYTCLLYTNTPRLVYIVQGRGHLGTVTPGCHETEESEQSDEEQQERQQQWQRRRQQQGRREGQFRQQGQQEFEQLDRHQKVRRIKEGDVIAIPAGVATWSHNDGDRSLVFVTLSDMSNNHNQLDRNPRRSYLAGNPQEEFNQQGQSQWR